ncbi:3-oxoacyl-[acyl-carrier-protein] synthase III [Nitratiruptor sp. YY08-26]|uniref:beta-ketoacyl-ACP synthase III n=1 Tax=unclassified Nitratiruptor TaxID=2624044 RepID=UPI0019154B34|nr:MULTISPECIES: beta-ketoacyl-ACP synthase III [unclassified Nitratiruptor]BCD61584.1 3-oxoacyl-[acyl-carrier-protein] synthase III [Nitratiruptor sp. YY08-13]BCD65518.1 3-oxoacyl-[acyl-carrier-protein] synthase III [Nitratiruptor sp. YY08-26]
MYAALRSIGAYIPKNVLTNHDLEKMVDTSDEWITKRTGIKTRYIADKDESTSDLGVNAARNALERAGMQATDVDMIVCATISPDYFCMPSTACMIAKKLEIANIPAFDISAACSGFIYALATAKAFIESGMAKNVLIIGAEKLSAIVDYTDRTTCILFGDGAGAAIVSATENKDEAIKDINIAADGKYYDYLITPGCGTNRPCSEEVLKERECYIKMKGNETFKVAVKTLTNDVVDILKKNGIKSEEIDFFVPHQANYRILNAVANALGLSQEQIVMTVSKYGNTSSASIPMAINEIYEQGLLKSGDLMLLDAFGGGFTWGSALVPFAGN